MKTISKIKSLVLKGKKVYEKRDTLLYQAKIEEKRLGWTYIGNVMSIFPVFDHLKLVNVHHHKGKEHRVYVLSKEEEKAILACFDTEDGEFIQNLIESKMLKKAYEGLKEIKKKGILLASVQELTEKGISPLMPLAKMLYTAHDIMLLHFAKKNKDAIKTAVLSLCTKDNEFAKAHELILRDLRGIRERLQVLRSYFFENAWNFYEEEGEETIAISDSEIKNFIKEGKSVYKIDKGQLFFKAQIEKDKVTWTFEGGIDIILRYLRPASFYYKENRVYILNKEEEKVVQTCIFRDNDQCIDFVRELLRGDGLVGILTAYKELKKIDEEGILVSIHKLINPVVWQRHPFFHIHLLLYSLSPWLPLGIDNKTYSFEHPSIN